VTEGLLAAMRPEVATRVGRLLGGRVESADPQGGGYTRAGSFLVRLEDGRAAFVKTGEDDAAAERLRVEASVLGMLDAPWAPRVLAWADDPALPLLAIEDLSGAHWPPPYPEDTAPLFTMLQEVAVAAHPEGLQRLQDRGPGQQTFWEHVGDRTPDFLALGLCTGEWLERALPALAQAERAVSFAGEDLCHLDVFSGNVCFVDGRGPVLIDWASPAIGNAWVDVGFAVVSVLSEGGRLPEGLAMPGGRSIAAFRAGHNAHEVISPHPEWARPDATLREDQLGDLRHALPWAAAELGLPPPDGDVAAYPGPRLAVD